VRRLGRFGALVGVLLAAAASLSATSNLNLSKSNIYRLTSHAGIVSTAQAAAMLAELDKLGPMDEAKLKAWLPANFRRFGIRPELVKKVVILAPGRAGAQTAIILLTDPADEANAVAATVKSSKSNISE
jgi:hypothetical protein